MRAFLFSVVIGSTVIASGQTPIILSSGASPKTFSQVLEKNPDLISLVDYQIKQKTETENMEALFAISEQISLPNNSILDQIEAHLGQQRLSPTGAQFLQDLLLKIQDRDLSAADKMRAKELLCFTGSLTQEDIRFCQTGTIQLAQIQKRFPWVDAVVIESEVLSRHQKESLTINVKSSYHIELLSNTHRQIRFYGKVDQLLQQTYVAEPLITGSCDAYSSQVDDWNLSQIAKIYFSHDCIKSVMAHQRSSDFKGWYEKNKPWVYGAGAAILGVLAYSLRDKTLVIQR